MTDEKILNNLLSKKEEINDLASTYGFKDVTIYDPIASKQRKKLHFFANYSDANNTGINLFKLAKLEDELSKVLECPVTFIPENAIDSDFKAIIMESDKHVKLNEGTDENLGSLLNHFLITDLTKGNKSADKNKMFSESETRKFTFHGAQFSVNKEENNEDEAIAVIEAAILSNKKISDYVSSHPEIFDKIKIKFSNFSGKHFM